MLKASYVPPCDTDFPHPTTSEAVAVFAILSKAHPQYATIRMAPKLTTNSAATCGNVHNVIDSLIGTILSQNTSGRNSSRAKAELDAAFGRNNFAAIARSPREAVMEAIRHGGLANKKAATIQNLLKSIEERHGDYSLQYLAETAIDGKQYSNQDVMKELTSYDGVGPKTASCVLMFCLGRDSFAVDTHIFRLSKVLGWVPSNADRILTQAHLDIRLPAELKYGLHVLMIQHGRTCKGCKKAGSPTPCILKDFVKANESRSPNMSLTEAL
ncbi:DNA glycosylase [Lentinula aciculospora]|uniref:DNA glycosylase n=1 Tax=Lentinula aciculospora TaxID=153920 RepID=A0A9W9A6Z5_9AGAR|nr:DNA glycosylase [Lentinula aciculospora]